ncbi:unnamed protein product [Ostreobium quekettii]|uniref:Protein arginine methyltransferase NDUFAF7 n=1 Tax=Ostreobium quekettii TaxID=121088 RepID=A0A8S1J5W2_9CHLO|nr:unnamed protein product [Ostreobium quekettii]
MVDVLGHLRDASPREFGRLTEYVILEISPALAEAQGRRAAEAGLADKVRVVNESALEVQEKISHSRNCFLIALEVLDNLPHDKVVFNPEDRWAWQAEVMPADHPVLPGYRDFPQARRSPPGTPARPPSHKELFYGVEDPLIHKCMDFLVEAQEAWDHKHAPRPSPMWGFDSWLASHETMLRPRPGGAHPASLAVWGKSGVVYLPTGQLKLLRAIQKFAPRAQCIFADFDVLPGPVMPGANGPSVRSVVAGEAVDHWDYLDPEFGTADVMFPTDFYALRYCFNKMFGRPTALESTAGFMRRFPEVVAGTTARDGTWLMEVDFLNTSMLVAEVRDCE